MDQASRIALGRHAQRHDRALAEGIKAKGETRSQFCHVIDVAPTILEAAGLPQPTIVNSVQQAPMEASVCSMRSTTPRRPIDTRHNISRCSATRNIPQGLDRRDPAQHALDTSKPLPAFDDDVWELYDTNKDWTQSRDIAKDIRRS